MSMAAQSNASATGSLQPKLRFKVAVNQGKWERLQYENYKVDQDVIRGIQAQIVDRMVKSGWFEVMEREATAMDAAAQEKRIDQESKQELAAQGRTTATRASTAVAEYIITPELMEFAMASRKSGGFSLGPISAGGSSTTAKVNLALRISSSATSSVIGSAMGLADKKESGNRLGLNLGILSIGGEQWNSSLASKAFEEAINKCVDDLIRQFAIFPWHATVAQVTEKTQQVVINRGSSAGVAEGMEFDVMELGEAVYDPDTGNEIAKGEETKVARVRVVRVLPGAAFCEVIEGQPSTVKKGFIVRTGGR